MFSFYLLCFSRWAKTRCFRALKQIHFKQAFRQFQKIRKRNQRKAHSSCTLVLTFRRWFWVQCIGKCLQTFHDFKRIRTYSGILRCKWAHSGMFFGIFITLCNPDIFKTLGIIRTRVYSELEAYRKLCQPSTMECVAEIMKGCNYFRNISFWCFVLYEINIMNFLKADLIFNPEVFILCKNLWGPRGFGLWILIYLLLQQLFIKVKERPFGSLGICIKNFIEYIWILVNCSNFFWKNFQQLLETSEVEPFLSTSPDLRRSFPQNSLEEVFCKANLRTSVL